MRTIRERMEEIKAQQEAGTFTRCPRCGKDTMKLGDKLWSNALSRVYDIMVCDQCGVSEALLDVMHQRTPVSEWECITPKHKFDFKDIPGKEVLERIAEQMPILVETFKSVVGRDTDADLEDLRLDTYERCPGLSVLHLEPFGALYETADSSLLVRFRMEGVKILCAVDRLLP